ncbi:MAG: alpha/beta hydrolase [Microbacterium sp.]|uniref:alpha/beta fold hydrolase n=1 Tax=Microbacterium sp. TaxID=51671 RepID=UPI000DB10C63|nr:alpha/beta hydrolase [Microbacterium sp.]PZU40935.1 MAG: alpha/beta hydrolase [Microbacterium sp.]
MTDAPDEFSFLAEQARDAGVEGSLPRVRRLTTEAAGRGAISALAWGDAPPAITLLHGAGLNAHTWDVTVLASGMPALAIDLPGHGDSAWRADADYRARVIAPDVAAAIETWTEGPQLLVGHSLGGLTAAAVAALRPDLVSRLVIIDITPGIDPAAGPSQIRRFFAGPTDFASRDDLVERALAFGLGGSRRAAERGVFLNSRVRPDGRVEWKHHFAHLAAAALAVPSGAAVQAPAPALSEGGWDDLAATTAPVTLLRGERGYVTPEDAREFARRVPTASIETLPAGHNVQEEMPGALGARIRTLATA